MPASPEAATPARIRSRATYRMFRDLLTTVQSGDQRRILTAVHRIIDSRRGFRSQRNSDCALQSMEMVLLDSGIRPVVGPSSEEHQMTSAAEVITATAALHEINTQHTYVLPTAFARDYAARAVEAEAFRDVLADTVPPVDSSFASANTLGNFPRR